MHAWLFLLIAAFFQTGWTYSLKYMAFDDLKTLRWDSFYSPDAGLPVLLPFLGNIVFGFVNMFFFSLAIKQIPTPTAFAIWTAMTLALVKLVDVAVFRASWSVTELFFLVVMGIGIVGLRACSAT
ncbi:DMT family transporter [Spirosoma aerolatum]|uniref:DMT family transporter n=1 Tax=Spirosoma aerolatum TaxID=1211326 RepID=UPI0009AE308C|nr:SMR family transporter [Spirosoma aerolatum]